MVDSEPKKTELSELEQVANKELKETTEDKYVAEDVSDDKDKNTTSSVREELLAAESWEELKVKENIIKGLLEMKFIKPSKIQAISYSLINQHPTKHLLAQSQNGSGKTGAFCIPTVSQIDENSDTVQAFVFGHTRELVNQNERVLQSIAKFTKIKVTAMKTGKETDLGHIVVCTPSVFDKQILRKNSSHLKTCKLYVLDEADFMLTNDNFSSVFQNLFENLVKTKSPSRVLFFSATFKPENFKFINNFFKKNILSIKRAKEELTLKTVKQMFIQVENSIKKDDVVIEYLKANFQSERVIIFANKRDNVQALQKRLNDKGYKAFILMGGDMDPANRDETVKRFNLGQIQILITTDLLSRGFDERLVKLIINYDIPLEKDNKTGRLGPNMETYLHRIGRTGRFGNLGIGLTIIENKHIQNIRDIEDFYKTKMIEIESMDSLISEFTKLLNQY